MKEGILYIVSGPSGSGKTSLVKALTNPDDDFIAPLLNKEDKNYLKQYADADLMKKAITHTTRDMRGGEVNGVDYHFTSKKDFEALLESDGFLEYAKVFDNYYGTSKKEVENRIGNGENVVLIIDWQGHRNIRATYDKKIHSIFLLPPSLEILKDRLVKRNEDAYEKIVQRIKQAGSDIEKSNEYDSVIVNDNFVDAAIKMKQSIINSKDKKKTKKTKP